jgi:hypothetical protein
MKRLYYNTETGNFGVMNEKPPGKQWYSIHTQLEDDKIYNGFIWTFIEKYGHAPRDPLEVKHIWREYYDG